MVRDSDVGPEVLLVKRRAGYAFGNAYAFPGGVIDPDESAARPVCAGMSEDDAKAIHAFILSEQWALYREKNP